MPVLSAFPGPLSGVICRRCCACAATTGLKPGRRRLRALFGTENLYLEVTRTLGEGEWTTSRRLLELADQLGVPPVATNPAHHATKPGYAAYETVCRVRLGLAPHEQHADLPLNGEGYLKSGAAMASLFGDRPDAVRNAVLLAERLAPPLDPSIRHLPRYLRLPLGESPFSLLSELTWCGAQRRYGGKGNGGKENGEKLDTAVRERLVRELETVRDLGYCDYFLVCWDICREAQRRGVRTRPARLCGRQRRHLLPRDVGP